MSGFKAFLLKGNLVDVAVGIVIGIAFGNVVKALIADLITPLISYFGHVPNFENLKAGPFLYGDFINVIISFIVLAVVVYFFVVSPYSAFKNRYDKTPVSTKECPHCLNAVPLGAHRCGFCTSDLGDEATAAS
ncbi:MAG TPA: MscL family protein [Candidatus Dormibacteraeota bacterium]|jgi:large conductance mechanosensitive channel|nr:MscL family protein [Candidatus Dormibacteraeota bacterium]